MILIAILFGHKPAGAGFHISFLLLISPLVLPGYFRRFVEFFGAAPVPFLCGALLFVERWLFFVTSCGSFKSSHLRYERSLSFLALRYERSVLLTLRPLSLSFLCS